LLISARTSRVTTPGPPVESPAHSSKPSSASPRCPISAARVALLAPGNLSCRERRTSSLAGCEAIAWKSLLSSMSDRNGQGSCEACAESTALGRATRRRGDRAWPTRPPAGVLQKSSERWRKGVVDQELHSPAATPKTRHSPHLTGIGRDPLELRTRPRAPAEPERCHSPPRLANLRGSAFAAAWRRLSSTLRIASSTVSSSLPTSSARKRSTK